MILESSPLWPDIQKIINLDAVTYRVDLRATLHTKKDDVKMMRVISVDVIRDYVHAFADQIAIEVTVGMGDYIKTIYPYRRNLEMTLYEYDVNTMQGDGDSPSLFERFKAIFLDKENPVYTTHDYDTIDIVSLNVANIVTLKLQLVNRVVEPMTAKIVHGTFKDIKPVDFLRSVLTFESFKVLVDGKPAIDSLDIWPADNVEVTKSIIVPSCTYITELPTLTQERFGGVYNTGIGNYLQTFLGKKVWFIYPLYDIKRFDKVPQKMVIYQIPKNRYKQPEHTWRIENNILYILCTSDRDYSDNRQESNYRDVAGFKMGDARKIMDKPVTMTADGPVAVRNKLNTEIATEHMPDQMTTSRPIDKRFSANNFSQTSRILSSFGSRINVTWESCHPDILLPGMPCQYNYMEGDVVKNVSGTLLYAQYHRQTDGKTVMTIGHITSAVLVLYLNLTGNLV